MGFIDRRSESRARACPAVLIPFIYFLFVFTPLFSQNAVSHTPNSVSLVSEIARLERLSAGGEPRSTDTAASASVTGSGAGGGRERYDAYLRLAQLNQLSGNHEAVLKAYEGALAVSPGDSRVLLEQTRFFVSLGDYEKAYTAIKPLLDTTAQSLTSRDRELLLQGRCLAAQIEAFRSGDASPLAALAADAELADYRSGIYYNLWKLTGHSSWKTLLGAEFPRSPEARISAGTVASAPTPFWLLFPGRDSIVISGQEINPLAASTVSSLPPSAANAAPASSSVANTLAVPSSAANTTPSSAAAPQNVVLQTGLFTREENALAQAESIRKLGFESRLAQRRVNNIDYWAVIVSGGKNINAEIKKLKDAGFESFPITNP